MRRAICGLALGSRSGRNGCVGLWRMNGTRFLNGKAGVGVWRCFFSSKVPGDSRAVGEFTNSTGASSIPLGKVERMLTLVFTCSICETRSARQFSHHSYTKGIVIIECPECKSKHLIADNLGWFDKGKNIEEILAKKGEKVRKLDGSFEGEVPEDLEFYVEQARRSREESLIRREELRDARSGGSKSANE